MENPLLELQEYENLLQAVQENREAAVSDEDSAAGLAALLSSGKNQCRTGKLKETSRKGDNDK